MIDFRSGWPFLLNEKSFFRKMAKENQKMQEIMFELLGESLEIEILLEIYEILGFLPRLSVIKQKLRNVNSQVLKKKTLIF